MSTHSHLQLEPDDMIDGRYRVVNRVADGGMGTVYLVEHALIKRRLALKLLHHELAHDENIVRQFMAEATAAGTLGHPNIVESTDMGFTRDHVPFIVFEYLEGPLLLEEIHRVKGMPVRRALRIATQIASALAAAHRADLAHLDLKSDNVILTDKDGAPDHVKVLDFGIARFMTPDPSRTLRHVIAGTPAFMAPEQVTTPDDVDRRADIYALGVVLYEMLTARRPFEGADPRTLLYRVVHEPVPVLRIGSVHRELEQFVVEGLLAKDREARVQTMEEVGERLHSLSVKRPGPSTFVAVVPPAIAARTTPTLAQAALDKPAYLMTPAPGLPLSPVRVSAIERAIEAASLDCSIVDSIRAARGDASEVIELVTPARPRLTNADLEVDIEVVPPARRRRRSRRGLALAVAALAVAGAGGAVRYFGHARDHRGVDPAVRAAIVRDGEKLAALIAVDARAATARAEAIAASPVVRTAVETDAQTVADLHRHGELPLSPEPGEVIEIVQQAGSGTVPLLRVPETGRVVAPANEALVATSPQVVASANNGGLEFVVGARIARAQGGVGGAVRVATPFAPELAQRLVGADAPRAELVGFAAPIALVAAGDPGDDTIEVRAPIPLGADVDVARPLALVAHVAANDTGAAWRVAGNAGLAGGGVVGLVLALGSIRPRRARRQYV